MQDAKDLVRQAQEGDSAAFAALYEQYAPTIYRFLRRRMDGPDEAVEDLTEDVFVKVYEKLDRYEERGLPFAAWLYRIAHNQLVDHVRTLPRLPARSLEDAHAVPEQGAGRAFGQVLDRQVLAPALASLTDEQRRVVQLRFLQGLSVADTAALMERSEEAVKKLQARGLANLRRLLTAPTPAPTPAPARLIGTPAHAQFAVA